MTFTAPAAGANLCTAGNTRTSCTGAPCIADNDAALGGWQGTLAVTVTVAGAPATSGTVTFTAGATTLGTANIDGSGNAQLAASIPDGTSVTITATTSAIGTAGMGMASRTLIVDTIPPMGPTGLNAVVANRRRTSFTFTFNAPAGEALSCYDVRAAREAINAGNFDAPTVAHTVPGPATPQAPGAAESLLIDNLFIETNYFFAVGGRDAVGNRGSLAATGSAVKAEFNMTTLTGTGTEGFGAILDGTSDLGAPAAGGGTFAADGLSDLLVGGSAGQNVYLFFGRATGYPAAPDVTFTGPAAARFGSAVLAAGDIDGDNLVDIAIGSPDETPAKVYIFSRKNAPWTTPPTTGTTWPATISSSMANYVINADPAYAASSFGFSLARLGNFDGATPDDFAIGAYLFGAGPGGATAGRVVVVRGSASFASFTLPAPGAGVANAVIIDGEATTNRFGRAVQGLADGTLVVAAPGLSATAVGRVYAFRPPQTGQLIGAATATDITVNAGAQYGFVIGNLGPLGASPTAVSLMAGGVNYLDVHLAPAASGPFGGASGTAPMQAIRFTSSAGNSLGIVNIGTVVPGSNVTVSMIGADAVADLVLAGQAEPENPIYIVSGASIPTLPSAVNLTTADPFATGVVAVRNRLPTPWVGYQRNTLVTDVNGDGFGDFAVGEFSSGAGRAIVFW